MGEAIHDDPFWCPLEMVAQREEMTKREMIAILTQAFDHVKLGGSDGGDDSDSDGRGRDSGGKL